METLSSHQTTVAHSQEPIRTAVDCEISPKHLKFKAYEDHRVGTISGGLERADNAAGTYDLTGCAAAMKLNSLIAFRCANKTEETTR